MVMLPFAWRWSNINVRRTGRSALFTTSAAESLVAIPSAAPMGPVSIAAATASWATAASYRLLQISRRSRCTGQAVEL